MSPEQKAEELYSIFDDLFSTKITVDAETTSEEITNFVKAVATKAAEQLYEYDNDRPDYWSQVITEIDILDV